MKLPQEPQLSINIICFFFFLKVNKSCDLLTCGVKLNELQVLAGQTGSRHHGVTVSCAGVGRSAAEVGASITTAEKCVRVCEC